MDDGGKVRAPFGCKGGDRGVSVGKRAIAVSIASGPNSTRPDYCTTLEHAVFIRKHILSF